MFVPLPRFKDKIKDCIIGTKLNITIIIDAGITNDHPITFLFFVFTVFPPIRIDFTAFFLKILPAQQLLCRQSASANLFAHCKGYGIICFF